MIANPKTYNDNNALQRRDAGKLFSLVERDYGSFPTFGTVVDVGCGTGNVTLDFLEHAKCEQIIAFDIHKPMIEFARENNKKTEVKYEVADITDNIEKIKEDIGLVNQADLVFSVYCLHWIADKNLVFNNINHFLKPGGKCYLILIYWCDLFPVQHKFLRTSKWSKYIENMNETLALIAPAYTISFPKYETTLVKWKEQLESNGFINCNLYTEHVTYQYQRYEEFTYDCESICPFIKLIPPSERNEFEKELYEFIRNNYKSESDNSNNNAESYYNVVYDYCIITAEKL